MYKTFGLCPYCIFSLNRTDHHSQSSKFECMYVCMYLYCDSNRGNWKWINQNLEIQTYYKFIASKICLNLFGITKIFIIVNNKLQLFNTVFLTFISVFTVFSRLLSNVFFWRFLMTLHSLIPTLESRIWSMGLISFAFLYLVICFNCAFFLLWKSSVLIETIPHSILETHCCGQTVSRAWRILPWAITYTFLSQL